MLRRGPVVTTIVVVPWAATERIDIERAVKLAGPELPADADFEIQGQDPMLPSPHYLGTGAAVARLRTGLAASELWQLRTGPLSTA